MRCLFAIDALHQLEAPIHLAIGVFDGVHRGHTAVLASAQARAKTDGGTAVVATFDPHPAEVLAPDRAPRRLTPLAHQRLLFQRQGMGAALAIPFDGALANQTGADFVQELTEACDLGSVHVGVDWVFGKGRRGNLDLLRELGRVYGFGVEGVEPVRSDGVNISSTAIRHAVMAGDLRSAERLLGRACSLFGTVEKGKQLGRKLGFPTANIAFKAEAVAPRGVYVVRVPTHGDLPGVANLGVRPSVGDASALALEVHLLDWSGDLYGEAMEAALLHCLRPERRFDSLTALRAQVERDLLEARAWLALKG